MRLQRLHDRANGALEGAPDQLLTVALLVIAALAVLVALRGSPVVKAAVATWLVLP